METVEIARDMTARSSPSMSTLLLADGTVFEGQGVGPVGIVTGELVFTTAMTGYQEALTDPSYRNQILLFTYPLIGTYGTAPGRDQSGAVQATAAVVSRLSPAFAGRPSLCSYVEKAGIPALTGVDTRAIARHIRSHGAMPAALAVHDGDAPLGRMTAALHSSRPTPDLVAEVTVREPSVHGAGKRHLAVLDCGNKRSVIDELVGREARVTVLPAGTCADEILALAPQGLVVSNGPGDPAVAQTVIRTVRDLYGRLPLFGICLGHQVIALAAGGRTYKLPFGHRGANHPVEDCLDGGAFITTQNHGYAVDGSSLPPDLLVSYRNVNDGTVEGLRHRTLPIRSVQFHPEGAPGPRDGGGVLDSWLEEIA